MPPAVLYLKHRLVTADRRRLGAVALLAALHLAAAGLLIWSEDDLAARMAFVLTWGLLNFFWLVLLRRPMTAAALSLALIVILIALSQFKHAVLMMTATFVDVMIIDLATFSFLMAIIPGLAWKVGLAVVLAIPVLLVVWQSDPFRVRRGMALLGCLGCLSALTALSFALPSDREDEFYPHQYVSKFARSASVATVDLIAHGVFEADAASPGRLILGNAGRCDAGRKLPHIVMVFDESSFDATVLPDVQVPPNYAARFRSSDGKTRSFVVEGAGGPSWYTEYNVLTGLSVRSYGRFAESATRLATGRVKRGLPHALRECGYRTYSLYSWFGGFVGARGFQTTAGIEHFLDSKQLGSGAADTDRFYYDHAARIIAEQRDNGPVFVFVYLAVNHFPWNYRYRPDLLPGWVNPGNPFEIDEYLRRQELSAHDYSQFKERLGSELPDDQFLLVRFGDHQPLFAKRFLEPDARSGRSGSTHPGARSALFHHVLCDRRTELPAARSFVRARYARRALPSAGGAGRSGGAARPDLRGAEANPQPLPRPVLSLRRRRRSPAFQPAADRCRPDPGVLKAPALTRNERALIEGRR